jgi:hypothetical protein
MIIKSLTRKTASYHQLLKYFVKEQKGGISKTEGFILKHNITGTNVSQWAKSFELNEAARLIKRSNSVKLYHEVMSISNLDAGKISPALLHDLASKYIELRNSNAMCIAVPHFDKAHIHIHFCFSGTEIETGKSLRISKADFAQFKKELQSYQMERYPALSNSVVAHGKKQAKKDKVKDREYQLKKRTKEPSERDRIKQVVDTAYAKSLSQADFMHRLSQQGLQAYSRSGRMQGIELGYKYRFGSLGFDERKLGELNYRDEALKGIQIFRDEKDSAKEVSLEPDIPYQTDANYKESANNDTDEELEGDNDIAPEADLNEDI